MANTPARSVPRATAAARSCQNVAFAPSETPLSETPSTNAPMKSAMIPAKNSIETIAAARSRAVSIRPRRGSHVRTVVTVPARYSAPMALARSR